jgi:hypothetical protein
MIDTETLSRELRHFTGSETWFRHGIVRDILFTEGAKHVADRAGAYWLLDEIALSQRHVSGVAGEEFQLWILAVNADHTGILTCEDGNGTAVYTKRIEYTDFPMAEITHQSAI